jgi:hypothetical protein
MTTKDTKKSCADLIDDNMKSREDDMREMMANANHDDYFDDPALSINTDKLTTVCLSWGGPADYLEIVWFGNDHNWEIKKVTYRYSDWYDTATREVLEDSPLYEYARNVIECGEI